MFTINRFIFCWAKAKPTLGLALVFLAGFSFAGTHEVSLREKIGQMLMFGFNAQAVNAKSPVVEWINKDNLGGVIAFDVDESKQKLGKNINSKTQIHLLTQELQAFTKSANNQHNRPNYPLLIAIDYEGGRVDRLKSAEGFEPTLSPSIMGMVTQDKLKHEISKMTKNLKSAGFNLDLAPIVDVNVNPKNPVIAAYERSYSSNPEKVTQDAKVLMNALRKNNIQCTLKHFPGHGSSAEDSHDGFVDITKTWQSYELYPYQYLISVNPTCGVIMAGHLINKFLDKSALPATLSYKMLTILLRNHLHFKGVILSDDMQMKAIADNYSLEEAVTLAVNAGVDILLFTNQKPDKQIVPKKIIDLIESQVKKGKIAQSRINESYERIQGLKSAI